MDNTLRFPFQTFEPINGHGYTPTGEAIHLKLTFIRHIEPDTTKTGFDCVVDYDGVKFYSNTAVLWRDDEDAPPGDRAKGVQLPEWINDIDTPIANNLLSMKEIDALKEGDTLARHSNAAPVTVISTKEAPDKFRLRDDRDNSYFNCDRHQMTFYGWRSPSDRV